MFIDVDIPMIMSAPSTLFTGALWPSLMNKIVAATREIICMLKNIYTIAQNAQIVRWNRMLRAVP